MERYLIAGLGNPGKQYAQTRHNIGFMAVQAFADKHGLVLNQKKANALISEGEVLGKRVLLAQPQTYMNNSGQSIRALLDFYKIPLARFIVVVDDLDTPLGTLRIRAEGGSAGQNGMKSLITHLGTQAFARIRFGIGRPPGKMDAAAYVLLSFKEDEKPLVEETLGRVQVALESWLQDGIEKTVSRYSGPPQAPKPNPPTSG